MRAGRIAAPGQPLRPVAMPLPVAMCRRSPPITFTLRNLTRIGVCIGRCPKFRPEVATDRRQTLLRRHLEGRLGPHVGHVLPPERAAGGLALLRARWSAGKVVIPCPDPAGAGGRRKTGIGGTVASQTERSGAGGGAMTRGQISGRRP